MNKQRRKDISEARRLLSEARDILERCEEEEQGYYDNMPEGIQSGTRGQQAEQDIDTLSSAADMVGDAIDSVDLIEGVTG